MPVHQFDYIFAIAMMFAFLDAWNIGANDVANSFATSVSSRSLTMKQAMCIASVMEFSGAIGVGARVADTIRTKILSVKAFEEEPTVLMLGMTCALVASSCYLTLATRIGLPVSTTHSIMGGVLGVGIAALGTDGVQWGWSGVSQVFAAWAIAPGIAGVFGACIFLVTKYGIMKRADPVRAAFISVPFYFALTSGCLVMLIVWKGAASATAATKSWGPGEYIGVIFGCAAGVALLSCIFLLPYLYRKLLLDDWQLRQLDAIYGPLLLRRGAVPPKPEGHGDIVQNYYRGHKTRAELDAEGREIVHPKNDLETTFPGKEGVTTSDAITSDRSSGDVSNPEKPTSLPLEKESRGKWYAPRNIPHTLKKAFLHGVDIDVVSEQNQTTILAKNLEDKHARVEHFDNKAEHVYSYLQILTAATQSFAHGANDVSNAVGPLAAVFLVWNTNTVASKSPVPIWILIYGGAAIVIGLWTYGYNIMRNLGNRLTLHSPCRGFSMELGACLTVVMATRLALPVSTTQCIVGATVGVGLCSGDLKAINWRMVAWIYGGWIITLPVTGIISGCLMGIILNAPQWGKVVTVG